MSATNALSRANMALTGYDHLIPFNEVVVAMDQVAKNSPRIALHKSRGAFHYPDC